MNPRLRRAAWTAALAVAALVATPGIAAAEPEGPFVDLEVGVLGSAVVNGGSAKPFRLLLANNGLDAARNVRLTVDMSGLDPEVVYFAAQEPACSVANLVATCELPDVAPYSVDDDFELIYLLAKKKGPAGTLKVSVTSDGEELDPQSNTTSVEVDAVPGGYDLQAAAWDVSGDPGETVDLNWVLYNRGDKRVKGIVFSIALPSFTSVARVPDNCEVVDDYALVCERPNRVVGPGEVFQMANPIRLTIDADAPGPMRFTGAVVGFGRDDVGADEPDVEAPDVLVGEPNAPTRRKIEADPTDNLALFDVDVASNDADLAVTSTPVTGAVGDIVTVPFHAVNRGPATSGPYVEVTAPAGTLLVPTPGQYPICWTDEGEPVEAAAALCGFESEFPAGSEFDFTLRFRIVSAPTADGTLVIRNHLESPDPNPADNTAPIVITVDGAGGGGGGGPLPVTGPAAVAMAGGGAAVVALGVVLLVFARRRRVVTVAGGDD